LTTSEFSKKWRKWSVRCNTPWHNALLQVPQSKQIYENSVYDFDNYNWSWSM